MAITKERKTELLDKARGIMNDSSTAVFVSARGMTAGDTNIMRSAMKTEEVDYAVIKKTLVNKVLDESSIPGDRPAFDGELSIAYGSDLIAPARLVREFQQKHKENITILGGIFDGEFKSQSEMTDIANIPDLQVLRGMFVNIINTPIQQLAVGVKAIAEKKEAAA